MNTKYWGEPRREEYPNRTKNKYKSKTPVKEYKSRIPNREHPNKEQKRTQQWEVVKYKTKKTPENLRMKTYHTQRERQRDNEEDRKRKDIRTTKRFEHLDKYSRNEDFLETQAKGRYKQMEGAYKSPGKRMRAVEEGEIEEEKIYREERRNNKQFNKVAFSTSLREHSLNAR
ncbi:Hypothetical predicted protein [Pelobates cultripes]|uniref:Uncharacterized protein n=1 Tax=Pelobates cultripes TaxID=61616 RepID=A0AAD1RFY1_PELCU|nr:Hypothetical predicted protein [Pelobates cultripes]